MADGPLTALGHLKVRTDENGYVLISSATGATGAGTTNGPLTPLLRLRGRTDGNGYLILSGS